jgi:chromosome segregation ATPase
MSLGKRLTGSVLAALGGIGIVACLAGVAGVWVTGTRLQEVNSEVFRQAEEFVVRLDRRAAQARDAVDGTRNLADELKQALQTAATELVAERLGALPEVDNLERRLASAMQRADGLLEVSVSTAELIEQVLTQVGIAASERDVEMRDPSNLTATIRSTQESLASASERLAEVEKSLAEIRQKRDVDVNLTLAKDLLLAIITRLDVVQDRLVVFRSRLGESKEGLAQFHDRMRTWILTGHLLMALLLIWIGAGQYCLFLRGWRILPPRSIAS